jgi:hypothetical protein
MGLYDFDFPSSWWRPDEAAATEERLADYDQRVAAIRAGARPMTLAELGSLIKQSEAELDAASDEDRPALRRKLDAMKAEFDMRQFMREDTTSYPAE